MVRMFVRHTVADYAAWRSVYDSIDAARSEAGVTGHAVFQAVDNPNDITASHDFDSAEAAHAFAGSPLLKDAMQRAGVTSAPDVWFTTST